MKIVFDSNVLIAAFASRGLADAVIRLSLKKHQIIVSSEILKEIEKAFLSKLKMPAEKVRLLLDFIKLYAVIEKPIPVDPESCRDPNDLHILGLAETATADLIITGDQDLLVLGFYKGIPILSPRRFMENERGSDSSLDLVPLASPSSKIHEQKKSGYVTRLKTNR